MTKKAALKKKISSGKVYDKERTKQKLIDAVGKILVKDGFQSIKINKIESVSKVSKKLIYRYFGNIDGLIKAYLQQKDFWNIELQKTPPDSKKARIPVPLPADEIFAILKSNFDFLENSAEMQKLVLWGISEKNNTHKDIAVNREKYGEPLLKRADLVFGKSSVDFRAVAVLLVSAAYYIIPHTKILGTKMCGIDTTKKEGMERVLNAMHTVIELCYQQAGKEAKARSSKKNGGSR